MLWLWRYGFNKHYQLKKKFSINKHNNIVFNVIFKNFRNFLV